MEVMWHVTMVLFVVPGNGFLTVYTQGNFGLARNGMYTCCIDGVCISTRIYTNSEYNNLFDSGELHEFYSITPFYCSFITTPIIII